MQRDIDRLAAAQLDLLVIGGGAYGVCAAWEAALRGLKVALIDRGDFGAATSSNSLHTMHGGLRYLQHFDIRRMRESIRERRFWLRAAPDLVTPMPFVLPTFGHGLRGPEVLQAALLMNDLISIDRNRDVTPAVYLPRGRLVSQLAARQYLSSLNVSGFNGAALWYDGFNNSPERLLVALLQAASDSGARLANYCAAEEVHCEGGRVVGAMVRDQLGGKAYSVRTHCVLNATGPWVDTVAVMAGRHSGVPLFRPSRAMNLVVPRLPFGGAVGIPVLRKGLERDTVLDKGAVTYFILPWGECSLIGTKHSHCVGVVDTDEVTALEVDEFLREINPMLGRSRIHLRDIVAVKHGLLPEQAGATPEGDVVLQKHSRIVDHEREDGISRFVSIIGVKWTTARLVAEQAVELVLTKLQRRAAPFQRPRRLVVADAIKSPESNEVISRDFEGQIQHVVKSQMAVQLCDTLFRRTTLGLGANLDERVLTRVAASMASALGWSMTERDRQHHLAQAEFDRRSAWRAVPPTR